MKRAINCIEGMSDMDEMSKRDPNCKMVSKDKINDEKLKILLNCAICHLKLQEYGDSISYSNQALEISKNNSKALFRRGLAKKEQGNYEESKKDFKLLLTILKDDKHIKLAKYYLKQIKKESIAKNKEQKQIFQGFLEFIFF